MTLLTIKSALQSAYGFASRLLSRSRLLLPLYSVGAVIATAGAVDSVYPVRGWLVWTLASLWFAMLAFSVACVSIGYATFRIVLRQHRLPTLETLVMSFALGLVAYALLMYVFGALAYYSMWLAFALPISMSLVGAVPLARLLRSRYHEWIAAGRKPIQLGIWGTLAIGAGACCVLLTYLGVMTPEAINFDAAWYHLPAAQDYARWGRIAPFYTDYNRAFPQLASLVYLWAWLLPVGLPALRWMLALHLEFLCFLWTLAGVAAVAQWILGRRTPATWAAFFLFPAIFVYDHNMGGAADHVLAVFAAPVLLATVRAAQGLNPRRWVLVGILLGGSLLTKYQAVYFFAMSAVLLGGALLWRIFHARELGQVGASLRQLLRYPALTAVAAALVSAPHFVKNYLFYNNPVYPFAMRLFTASYPQHAQSLTFMDHVYSDRNCQFYGPLWRKIGHALLLVLRSPYEPHYSFTRNVPMLGFLWVLLLPFALFLPRRRLWLALAATYVATFAWAYTYFVDRYLQVLVPLMAASTAALMVMVWRAGGLVRLALIPLVALQVAYNGDAPSYGGAGRIISAMTMINTGFDRRVKQRFPYRQSYLDVSKKLPKDARVLLFADKPNLGIDRDIVFDATQMQGLVLYDDIHSARGLYEYYKALGVTHLLWRTPSVGEHNKHAEVLFADLVAPGRGAAFRSGDLTLMPLPSSPPPPRSRPYRVLAYGTSLRDGLYELQQLAMHEMVPEPARGKLPDPIRVVDRDEPTAGGALGSVDAIIVGRDTQIAGGLRTGFTLGMQFRAHDIWIRVRTEITGSNSPSLVPR